MVVKVSQEVAFTIKSRLNYGITKGEILDCASRNDYVGNNACLNTDTLSHDTLYKALYEGYEVEKTQYTEQTLPKHFKFKIGFSEYFYDGSNGVHVVMWTNGDDIRCATYATAQILELVNYGAWKDIEVITE